MDVVNEVMLLANGVVLSLLYIPHAIELVPKKDPASMTLLYFGRAATV